MYQQTDEKRTIFILFYLNGCPFLYRPFSRGWNLRTKDSQVAFPKIKVGLA